MMMTTTSEATMAANRANAALSTGPTSDDGKAVSSGNAIRHGLTAAKFTLFPGESGEGFDHYVSEHVRIFAPFAQFDPDGLNLVTELAGLRWRMRRIPDYEAKVLDAEIQSLLTSTAPDLAERVQNLTPHQIEGLAYIRLVERKILPNLHAQEARLNRRMEKIMKQLLSAPVIPEATGVETTGRGETENCKNEPIPARAAPATNPAVPSPATSTKVGRNEPCPCGSNLKYKRCCGNPVRAASAAAAAA
jgi:hypothetical protein